MMPKGWAKGSIEPQEQQVQQVQQEPEGGDENDYDSEENATNQGWYGEINIENNTATGFLEYFSLVVSSEAEKYLCLVELDITESQKEENCDECDFAFSVRSNVEVVAEEDCSIDIELLSSTPFYFGYAQQQIYKKEESEWIQSGWAEWSEDDSFLEFLIEE